MSRIVPASQSNIELAARLLSQGELVCFPTETVYGVGADAGDSQAVMRIFAAKGRPADHPLIVHLADVGQLQNWAREVPDAAFDLGQQFWPGPLTLVLRRAPQVPLEVTGGQDTVALRMPGHPVARRLLEEFGGGIAAPSANRFGRISPTTAQHAAEELGEWPALVLDGGDSSIGLESTIVDMSGAEATLLRPGGVARDVLERFLGIPLRREFAGRGPRAPGRLPSHYAPTSPLSLATAAEIDERVGEGSARAVLAPRPAPSGFAGAWERLPGSPEGYAQGLYAALRRLDALGVEILAEQPPLGPAWEAVNDRLRRAAGRGDGEEGQGGHTLSSRERTS